MRQHRQFPDLSRARSADTDVQLNGQQVVFDKLVTLTPVKVEPKNTGDE